MRKMNLNGMKFLIKFLLNTFSRKLLISLSIKLRPLFNILFSGDKYIDPINEKSYSKFFPYGYNKTRRNALSLGTLSLERHRLLWLYLKNETSFFNQNNITPKSVEIDQVNKMYIIEVEFGNKEIIEQYSCENPNQYIIYSQPQSIN